MITKCNPVRRSLLPLAAAVALTACAVATTTKVDIESYRLPTVRADTRTIPESEFVKALGRAQVVAVGEHHDRYDHHLNQLEVVRLVHRNYGDIAIGMEYFQQPFQEHLDAYVRGDISINEMLRGTEYYDRWKYDFRLNEPVLRYAREHGIPLVALNIPAEVTRKFQMQGMDGLSEEDKQWIPHDIDRSNEAYRQRLEKIFKDHPISAHGSIERLIEGQLLWDEGMARRAADYLRQHPGRKMVILAGRGHIEFGYGIPQRVERRLGGDGEVITVVQDEKSLPDANADFVVISKRRYKLPKSGLLGVFIERGETDATVSSLSDESAARAAGILEGDVITAIDSEPVSRFADLKASLWDKLPGDMVLVRVRRSDSEVREFQVVLR